MTPTEGQKIKERFRQQGKTIADWARQHGFVPNKVHQVLNGQIKGHYGVAHDIAKALGMK